MSSKFKINGEDQAWLDYRAKFSEVYDDANYASSLQSKVMHQSHKMIEKKYSGENFFSNVIEIGAGTGEHLSFVRHQFDRYELTDLDTGTLDVAKSKLAGNSRFEKLSFKTLSGDSLPYEDNSFDRLIATHVLEHLYQPHLVLKEWARVIKNGGVLSIVLPTDPGLAWRFGRCLGPRKNAIEQGISYDYVMAREHVNSCVNLVALIRHYFPVRNESWWPLSIQSVDLNLFFSCNIVIDKG